MHPKESTLDNLLVGQEAESTIDFLENPLIVDFETAVDYAKYGKFQRILLLVCGIIYATCAISTATLSFVLPSAECDFDLTSTAKGKLSAMPLIGMIFGCCLWGSLADAKGRKLAIILSLLVDFLAGFISAFVYNYRFFLVCRFFNGFGIIGATSLIFSYFGEFLSNKHRDVLLGRLEVFWTLGIIILPGFAWSLLNPSFLQSFKFQDSFSPWRIFVLACSLPSLLGLILLSFLPETPKFLISRGEYTRAKAVFQTMFRTNTNQTAFPNLILEEELENNNSAKYPDQDQIHYRSCFGKIEEILQEGKLLFQQPYLKFLSITCFIDFGLMASYYTLIMWFPEIFDRFQDFEAIYPNRTAGVCSVSKYDFKPDPKVFTITPCDSSIDNSVFLDTLIIGLSCLPTSLSLSFFMETLGKKILLAGALISSGTATLLLIWMENTLHTLLLSCIFEALTSILEACLFCVVVDLFPTNLRAIALTLTVASGRIGAILGNLAFGMLFDLNCAIPICLFGCLLIGSGFLCLLVPKNNNYSILH